MKPTPSRSASARARPIRPDPISVADPADPRIAPFVQLREKDLVGRQGGFIAEGEVVLAAWLRSGRHEVVSLLLAPKRLAKLAPLLAMLGPQVPVYVAEQAVLDAIAGYPLHRGILAFGRAVVPDADALLAGLPEAALVIALFGLANHDNMGGVFRNAAAFGAQAVLVDSACCDPFYRKAIRVSVGGVLTTPFARCPADETALDLLERHGFTTFALSPAGALTLRQTCPAPRSALLFGAEGPGLDAAILRRTTSVRLDMAGGFDSLNVATTSGIVMHHFA